MTDMNLGDMAIELEALRKEVRAQEATIRSCFRREHQLRELIDSACRLLEQNAELGRLGGVGSLYWDTYLACRELNDATHRQLLRIQEAEKRESWNAPASIED
jgi:hypothetical protein